MINSEKWWPKHLLLYSVAFTIIALILFLPYFITGTSFVLQADGISQHVPALVEWQKDLHHLLSTHTWPEQWNFKLGLGADYYQTFAHYTLGDIFSYGVAFIGAQHVVTYYNVMIIVRLFCSGLAFLVAVRHFLDSERPLINVLASMGYLFTGYTAFSMYSHPFFINPLIIFPLLIVALDNVIASAKPKYVPFTVMVAWTLWNNYYFAFLLALGALIFFSIKTSLNHQWLSIRYWVNLLVPTMIGLLLPMILLLPSLLGMFSSARSNPEFANGLFLYPLNYYLALPGTLMSNIATPNFWLTGGFSIIGLIGVIYVVRRFNHYPVLTWIFIISGIMLLSPIFAAIMNGGSSPSNRWILMLALPVSLASIILLNNLNTLQKKDFYWMTSSLVVASVSLLYSNNFDFNSNYAGMLLIAVAIVATLSWYTQHTGKLYLISFLAIFNIFVIMVQNTQVQLNPNKSELLSNTNIKKLIDQQTSYLNETDDQKIAKATGSATDPVQSNLYRSYIDTQLGSSEAIDPAPATNLALLSPAHNAESYWSYQNGAVSDLFQQLELPNISNNNVTSNFDQRNVLSNTLGIKYWYPNAESQQPDNYKRLPGAPSVNQQPITKSDYVYPLAYLNDQVLSEKAFKSLDPTMREAALADRVVADTTIGTQQESKFAQTVMTVPLQRDLSKPVQTKTHITFSPELEDDQTGIYLPENADLDGTEVHLKIENITYKPASFQENADFATANYLNTVQQKAANPQKKPDYHTNAAAYKFNWQRKHLNTLGKSVSGYSLTAKYNGYENTFTQTGRKNLSFYNPKDTITMNLGPATDIEDMNFIGLNFSQPGTYSFDVSVKAIPTDKRFKQVARKAQANAVPLTYKDDQLQGEVNTDRPTILTTSIPYSDGWTSKNQKIIQVNNGFIGLELNSGKQEIDLRYQTPGLKLGYWLSVTGLILIVLVGTTSFVIKKRAKK
ncbi:YfhO family protein [Weissella minor]|uniref:YfhO family protein n=1 Tax=Weissella minor TaxID=1620 RepID=UPI003AF1EA03